jgi:hypothetical protein
VAWTTYQHHHTGECHVVIDRAPVVCEFTIGVVVTGKQKVFKAHYIAVTLPSGGEVLGEHPYNVRDALRALASTMSEQSLDLQAIGLSKRFSESGLSHNSGWGYVKGHPKAIHMMDVLVGVTDGNYHMVG